MKIEILFAVDQEDNTKISLLAVPYGESAGTDSVRQALMDKLSLFSSDISEHAADIDSGEETSYNGYDFGWETIELITDKIIIRPL